MGHVGAIVQTERKVHGPIITKILITNRWRLNTLIDAGQAKPADVSEDQWNVRAGALTKDRGLTGHVRAYASHIAR